ncbi:MAG TPA: VOC family protein [Terriglobales bacterium]|nr:VOC family protein [Terriglobales bacterium]
MGVLGINHIAFRSPDAARLRSFYADLLGAESLSGAHEPLRVGTVLLVFFSSEHGGAGPDADEIAFDVDARGFEDVLARAHRLGTQVRGPLEHSAHSRGFYVGDPEGRRVEIIYEDRGVFWKED